MFISIKYIKKKEKKMLLFFLSGSFSQDLNGKVGSLKQVIIYSQLNQPPGSMNRNTATLKASSKP